MTALQDDLLAAAALRCFLHFGQLPHGKRKGYRDTLRHVEKRIARAYAGGAS